MAGTEPDHVVFKPLELVCGRNLEESGNVCLGSSRVLYGHLVGNCGGSTEGQNMEHPYDKGVENVGEPPARMHTHVTLS